MSNGPPQSNFSSTSLRIDGLSALTLADVVCPELCVIVLEDPPCLVALRVGDPLLALALAGPMDAVGVGVLLRTAAALRDAERLPAFRLLERDGVLTGAL